MKEIITLSAEGQEDASALFTKYLDEAGLTLLLILGSDAVAENSLDHIKNHMLNHRDYISVEFIHVPDCDLIHDILQDLKIEVSENNHYTFENIGDYSCLTISPEHNILADAIQSQDLFAVPGKMKTAILRAFRKS